MTAFGWKISKL